MVVNRYTSQYVLSPSVNSNKIVNNYIFNSYCIQKILLTSFLIVKQNNNKSFQQLLLFAIKKIIL